MKQQEGRGILTRDTFNLNKSNEIANVNYMIINANMIRFRNFP